MDTLAAGLCMQGTVCLLATSSLSPTSLDSSAHPTAGGQHRASSGLWTLGLSSEGIRELFSSSQNGILERLGLHLPRVGWVWSSPRIIGMDCEAVQTALASHVTQPGPRQGQGPGSQTWPPGNLDLNLNLLLILLRAQQTDREQKI